MFVLFDKFEDFVPLAVLSRNKPAKFNLNKIDYRTFLAGEGALMYKLATVWCFNFVFKHH